ncbi:hypothetical protein BD410DRAFT_846524 [Rickenella mellea]|uniref:Uncharacterized protein n=1 Tax=Rickenella mellea TaxID=50990 RepID=A0A4Y7PES2_9AGAM|nr:hypothetical protein BD410DRAFT_846524 [Rickenella mellea]
MSSIITSTTAMRRREDFAQLITVGRDVQRKMGLLPSTKETLGWGKVLAAVVGELDKVVPSIQDQTGLESRISLWRNWKRELVMIDRRISGLSDDDRELEHETTLLGRERHNTDQVGQKRSFIAEDPKAAGEGMEQDKVVGGPAKKAKTAARSSGAAARKGTPPGTVRREPLKNIQASRKRSSGGGVAKVKGTGMGDKAVGGVVKMAKTAAAPVANKRFPSDVIEIPGSDEEREDKAEIQRIEELMQLEWRAEEAVDKAWETLEFEKLKHGAAVAALHEAVGRRVNRVRFKF